ncbi:NfeD family protein [Calidifontibacter terrae]
MDAQTIFWIVIGVTLIATEVLGGEFVMLMLGVGALSAGGASAAGAAPWLSALVFALVSVVLLLGVRPPLKRHYLTGPIEPMNTDALLGATAEVVESVDSDGGRIKIGGDLWSARAAEPSFTYDVGSKVVVQQIDGAIAVVETEN